MTRDEIEQFLEDWDIAPIRNNIDMIEELIADTWQEGYEAGYEEGQGGATKRKVESYNGKKISNGFCNGYFGRVYDMEGSTITAIEGFGSEESGVMIKLSVIKTDGESDFATFNTWEEALSLLEEWVIY